MFNKLILKRGKRTAFRAAIKQSCTAAMLLLTSATTAVAQGNGTAGIQAATDQIQSYFDPATTLMYVVGAVAGLVGAIKVFLKWNSGDQDTQKTAMGWFGSCIFLVVAATILRAFFL